MKIDLSTFTKVSTLAVGGTDELVADLAASNNYLYASRGEWAAGRDYITKVDLSTFTVVASLAVPSGWYGVNALLIYKNFLYVGFIMPRARICKIDLTTFTTADTLIFDTYDYEAHDLALH